jgi:hypothetical protein
MGSVTSAVDRSILQQIIDRQHHSPEPGLPGLIRKPMITAANSDASFLARQAMTPTNESANRSLRGADTGNLVSTDARMPVDSATR